jgi:hypothetical protein
MARTDFIEPEVADVGQHVMIESRLVVLPLDDSEGTPFPNPLLREPADRHWAEGRLVEEFSSGDLVFDTAESPCLIFW